MFSVIYFAIFVTFCRNFPTSTGTSQPHIVFILADDLGWNDVSFHGSDQIPTPNIDALAYNSIILHSHYVLPICTPSRSALMTGQYPIHTGMQGSPMLPSEARGLPLGKILPDYLGDLGYSTVAIGKWHLGYYSPQYLPNNRGIDSFLGFYNGHNSYYNYIVEEKGGLSGFDLRRNTTPAHDLAGQYSTHLFTDEAVNRISEHDPKIPLFLYLSHMAVHSTNVDALLEPPLESSSEFSHISNPNRRKYAQMVAALDESVGRVMEALEANNMLHNSIVIFMSDNGAPTSGDFANFGSNYPLRGIKETLWEGGVRNPAFIWSPRIVQTPRVSNQLMHITDWLPTLYAAAGGEPENLPRMDGMNLWYSLSQNLVSPRKDVLLNIDEQLLVASLLVDTPTSLWKLVLGGGENSTSDEYSGEGTNIAPESNPPYNIHSVMQSKSYGALSKLAHKQYIRHPSNPRNMFRLRDEATVKCSSKARNRCQPKRRSKLGCLFDINVDPCEMNNLANQLPSVAKSLYKSLVSYRKFLVPQRNRPREIELSNPAFFNGTWSSWYGLDGLPLALGLTI